MNRLRVRRSFPACALALAAAGVVLLNGCAHPASTTSAAGPGPAGSSPFPSSASSTPTPTGRAPPGPRPSHRPR